MFFNAVSNGEGTSYVPTALGSALMAVVFCALLGGALYLIAKAAVSYRKKSEGGLPAPGRLTPKKLAFCAVAVALGVVLSNVKLFHFPTGGSITLLSMLVVCLPGYWFGLGAGLTTGLSYGLLQLVTNPYVVHPAQLVIEYFLAFGSLGLSGIFFREKNGLQKCILGSRKAMPPASWEDGSSPPSPAGSFSRNTPGKDGILFSIPLPIMPFTSFPKRPSPCYSWRSLP